MRDFQKVCMGFYTAHLFSQTDPRWSKIKLGKSTAKNSTIGDIGCAMTAVCNLQNLLFGTRFTPQEVNQWCIEKDVYSYSNGYALMNWTRVYRVFPGLKFVYRDWNYSNLLVWRWINISPKVPVIVCAKTRFAPQHFFVFIGGGKMVDSLDGRIKPTSSYSALTGSVRFQ